MVRDREQVRIRIALLLARAANSESVRPGGRPIPSPAPASGSLSASSVSDRVPLTRGLPLGIRSWPFQGTDAMPYDFLIDTYDTERIKVVSVWSEFTDDDLPVRPRPDDPRGRSVHEQMVHQCVSEDLWFRGMLGIDVEAPPLPRRKPVWRS